ncbi:MAG: DUF2188 domain-containing protein [Cyanosarcina radialis HA8281-LM2]|jgi:microcompartment protein CcmL/EutN|nr:DUF2188 domain-containing protein [Cyanosarcina radialis HA8281-LM2]
MSKKVHVVPQNGAWEVKVEGNPNPLSNHQTQAEAIDAGKPFAQQHRSELVIHRPNGQIREAWSYGNDPHRSRG